MLEIKIIVSVGFVCMAAGIVLACCILGGCVYYERPQPAAIELPDWQPQATASEARRQ